MNVCYTTVYRIFTDSNIVPEHKTRNVTVWYTSTVKSMSFVGNSFLWIALVCLSINLNVDVREFPEMNMCWNFGDHNVKCPLKCLSEKNIYEKGLCPQNK